MGQLRPLLEHGGCVGSVWAQPAVTMSGLEQWSHRDPVPKHHCCHTMELNGSSLHHRKWQVMPQPFHGLFLLMPNPFI